MSIFISEKDTSRGFHFKEFRDLYGSSCSIQKSSLACREAIWFGVNDASPKIMDTTGWVDYPIPDEVLLSTRMHLSQEQVKELLPVLQHFAETGELLCNQKEEQS